MKNIDGNMDQYGIQLLSVETKRLDLPADNKAAVYERMISERDKIAATYTAEGQSEAKVIQNTTDREIAISISDAQAEAARTTAAGEAEYMRILAEAYNTPERAEFYEFTRALDAAKASLTGSNNTLILPADSPIAGIFMGREDALRPGKIGKKDCRISLPGVILKRKHPGRQEAAKGRNEFVLCACTWAEDFRPFCL